MQESSKESCDAHLLITGAGGLLGSNLVDTAVTRGYDVIASYHSRPISEGPESETLVADVTETGAFQEELASQNISHVINCAALTDVDKCERYPRRASRVNGQAPGHIAAACEAHDVGFCQISTDYVFSEPATHPIPEDEETDPIQVYGRTKLRGEQSSIAEHPEATIVRISFLYGIRPLNDELVGLPQWILSQIQDGLSVPLYTDQLISPTYARAASETILDLVSNEQSGIFHGSDFGCVTPYQFGTTLLDRIPGAKTSLVEPSSLDNVDKAAKRPENVCLSVEKIETTLERPQPKWTEGIDAIVSNLPC